MNVDYFRRLFSYTEWANAAFFECIRGLTEEQYTREIPSSRRDDAVDRFR